MNENNELSDIVLNKSSSSNSNKKIILAVATLGIILIIVVMLMNSLSSNGTDNLPQAVLPPEPQQHQQQAQQDEPLFEEVEVIEDDAAPTEDVNLDKIAQKLKAQSAQVVEKQHPVTRHKTEPKPVTKKVHTQKQQHIAKTKQTVHKHTATKSKKLAAIHKGAYYIQVGSFSKYEPNKKFLRSITNLGYHYTYHKVGNLNKVLVGPFKTNKEAQKAKKVLRAKVVSGAFLVKL